MGFLDDLCYRLRRISFVGKLHTVINPLIIFINCQGLLDWIFRSLIVRSEIRGCDRLILVKKILKNIAGHDSEEASVIILQLFQLCVFGGVYDLFLECFAHCACILIDSPPFVILKLELF